MQPVLLLNVYSFDSFLMYLVSKNSGAGGGITSPIFKSKSSWLYITIAAAIITKRTGIKFKKLFPEIPVQIIFDSPYYKLTVGNFRKRNEALKVKDLISTKFPGAHHIKCVINPRLIIN